MSSPAPRELPVWGQALATPAGQRGNRGKFLVAPCQGPDEAEVSPHQPVPWACKSLSLGKQQPRLASAGVWPGGQGGDAGHHLRQSWPQPLCGVVGCLPLAQPCLGFHPSPLTLSFLYQSQTHAWAQNPLETPDQVATGGSTVLGHRSHGAGSAALSSSFFFMLYFFFSFYFKFRPKNSRVVPYPHPSRDPPTKNRA